MFHLKYTTLPDFTLIHCEKIVTTKYNNKYIQLSAMSTFLRPPIKAISVMSSKEDKYFRNKGVYNESWEWEGFCYGDIDGIWVDFIQYHSLYDWFLTLIVY